MNLGQLNKIDIKDLKNIDYVKLAQVIKKRPDALINTVAIVGLLFFTFQFYTKRQIEVSKLKKEITASESKLEIIEIYNQTQTGLKEFMADVPKKITADDLINLVTDFAVASNVQIESFSPAKKQSESLYDLTSIILNISADDYKSIWLFIHNIEKSEYAVRIDNWTGYMGTRTGRQRQNITADTSSIKATLEIASINFKEG